MVLARPLLSRTPEEPLSLEELDAAIVTINEVPLTDEPDRQAHRTAVHELMRLRDAVFLEGQGS